MKPETAQTQRGTRSLKTGAKQHSHVKCTVSPPGSIALSANNNCLVSSRSHVPGSATYKSQQGYPTITSNNPTRGSYNNNQLTYRTEVTVRGGHSWQAGNNSLTLCVTPQTETIAVFFTSRARILLLHGGIHADMSSWEDHHMMDEYVPIPVLPKQLEN